MICEIDAFGCQECTSKCCHYKEEKLDYQVKISEILDNALQELGTDKFDELIVSILEAINQDYSSLHSFLLKLRGRQVGLELRNWTSDIRR